MFVATEGTLAFPPASRQQTVNLLLIDDSIPEFARNFSVALSILSPTEARLGISILTLRLAESDYPYGLISLTGVAVLAPELDFPNPVSVLVARDFGRSGEVSVEWQVASCLLCPVTAPCRSCPSGTIAQQLAPTQGIVTFADGQRNASIVISTLPDTDPEMEMRFTLALSGASPATIGPDGGATDGHALVVPANDDAYGAFEILVASAVADDSSRRTARIFETANARVPLEVHRRGGALGPATVDWRVHHVTTSSAANQQPVADVLVTNGTLFFGTGVELGSLSIPIGNDDVPEIDEQFIVELFRSTGGATIVTPNVTITILENDDARGVIGFSASAITSFANEDHGVAHMLLERQRGLFGSVSAYWEVTSGDPSGDLQALNGTTIFAAHIASANLSIPLRDDAEPETAESFVVQLQEARGGARLGSRTIAVLTIRGSDDPHGVFQFSESTYEVIEPEMGTSIAVVDVERIGGALGAVAVRVEVRGKERRGGGGVGWRGEILKGQVPHTHDATRFPLSSLISARERAMRPQARISVWHRPHLRSNSQRTSAVPALT